LIKNLFINIDLRNAYNLGYIKEINEWKTTICTRYGHFKYNVKPFGLTNALTIFQNMNNIVKKI
jgi:hypothetical protein